MPLTAHHPGCRGQAIPLPVGRNPKHREIPGFDSAKRKHLKNTHRRLSVYAFRLRFITAIPDDCRHLISAVTPHQDLSLFSLGPSQHGLITLLPTALPPLISQFPHPASRSAHHTEAAEHVPKARHTVRLSPPRQHESHSGAWGSPHQPHAAQVCRDTTL